MKDTEPLPSLEGYSADEEYDRPLAQHQLARKEVLDWMDQRCLPVEFVPPRGGFPGSDLPKGEDSDEVIAEFTRNVAWHSYLTGTLNDVFSLKLAAEHQVDYVWSKLWEDYRRSADGHQVRGKVGGRTTEDIKAAIQIEPRYQAALVQLTKYRDIVQRLEGLLNAVNKNIATLSRQITVRGQDINATGLNPQGRSSRKGDGNTPARGQPSF